MVGEITVTGTILTGTHDTSAGIFQIRHVNNRTAVFLGRDGKFGLPQSISCRYEFPEIPPRSKITNAFARFTASLTSASATSATNFYFMQRDGKWNKDSRDGWSTISTWDFNLIVKDTGDVTKIETLPGGTAAVVWGLRNKSTQAAYLKLGQSVANDSAGGDFTLGSIDLELAKVGSPSGEVGVEVYRRSPTTDLPGEGAPVLATSSGIDVSTIGAKAFHTFDFIDDEQITISGTGNDRLYFIALTGTYASSATDYINFYAVAQTFGFSYTGGRAATSGTGLQFDDQNYPDEASVPRIFSKFGSTVSHTFPISTAGVSYDTGDLSLIVQEAINDPGYEEDGNIVCLYWDGLVMNVASQRPVALFEHASLDAEELIITFIPRRIITVM